MSYRIWAKCMERVELGKPNGMAAHLSISFVRLMPLLNISYI